MLFICLQGTVWVVSEHLLQGLKCSGLPQQNHLAGLCPGLFPALGFKLFLCSIKQEISSEKHFFFRI